MNVSSAPNNIPPTKSSIQLIWDRLVEPHPAIQDFEERKQARLLASLLLVLIPFTLVGAVFSMSSNATVVWVALLVVSGASLALYGLGRTIHFKLSITLTLGIFSLVPFVVFAARGEYTPIQAIAFMWAPLPILLGSILLSRLGVYILALFNWLGFIILPILVTAIPFDLLVTPFSVVVVFSLLIFVATNYRFSLEQERLRTIEQRNQQAAIQGVLIEQQQVRERDLRVTREVSNLLTQSNDLQVMLGQVIETIRSHFELYYVQLYLADTAGRTLILQAGTGEVGDALVQRGHRLLVGLGSINGAAAAQKQTVVVQDTGKSSVHQINPLLPRTRSAMAVPMLANNRLLGTLNMQSEKVGWLNSDMLPVFEALAAQLALAIYNVTLFAEVEQTTNLMEAQARQVVSTGWNELLNAVDKQEHIGVAYELTQAEPLADIPLVEGGLVVPVKVAEQSVGTICLQDDVERVWRTEELEVVQAVAEKVARQVENLRLLAQADQYRMRAEAAARRLTHEGWQEFLATADFPAGYKYDLNEVTLWTGEMNGDMETAVSHPLVVNNAPIGKLTLNGVSQLDPYQHALVNAVVSKVSDRIETLRLASQTEQALTQTEMLYRGSEQIVRAQNLQEVLLALVRNTSLSRLDRASISLYNRPWMTEMPETITTVAGWDKHNNQQTMTFTPYPLQHFPFSRFISRERPIIVYDITTDPRMDENLRNLLVQQLGVRGLINLPVVAGGVFIGAVVGMSNQPFLLTDDEVKQISSLTDQASAVIQNLRLFEETQTRAEEERLVNEITQKIQATSSIESALQTTIQELGLALQARYTAIELASDYVVDATNGHTA